jgi:hypothetical protein
MKRFAAFLVLAFAVTAIAQTAPAAPPPTSDNPWVYSDQNRDWDPSWNQRPDPNSGACFYTDASYSGNHFCVHAGDRLPELPGHFGHHITSVQIFGNARVRLFNDSNYKNGSTILEHSVDNLRDVPFRGGHTWNDRIGSVVVF